VANDPIAELKRRGVPCEKFEADVLAVLREFSQDEVAAFANIWRKAGDKGLNDPQTSGSTEMRGWIFGRVGY
jgi:hypothetical protein